MSCICPRKSTESNVSPCCWERIAVGVVMTAAVPAQAQPNEAHSFRSPSTSLPPSRLSVSFFAGSEVDRTMARNGLPADARRRQISVPSKPVAPITSVIGIHSQISDFACQLGGFFQVNFCGRAIVSLPRLNGGTHGRFQIGGNSHLRRSEQRFNMVDCVTNLFLHQLRSDQRPQRY